ncbi:hypothetical protein WA026_010643 [Henosepilachna vigintioctopunctata]|uniref:C2H2-type domain-containing protein n=1 Tax=Henosepilachna vigintioctopunctata TaxID=420089 RepID=A0AAW1URH2_9CUCU
MEHRKVHSFHCRTCDTYYASQRQYNEHIRNHVLVYCCHICNHEFLLKLSLKNHLNLHQEQDILKNVLELEQNYSHYLINFATDTYTKSINKITSFLNHNYEYKYSHHGYKIRCHLCYLEFFKCDFEQHLKLHYFFKNHGAFYSNSMDYPVMQ